MDNPDSTPWKNPWNTDEETPGGGVLLLYTPGDINGDLQLGSFEDGLWRNAEGIRINPPQLWSYTPKI